MLCTYNVDARYRIDDWEEEWGTAPSMNNSQVQAGGAAGGEKSKAVGSRYRVSDPVAPL
jgi:hypothetical protein